MVGLISAAMEIDPGNDPQTGEADVQDVTEPDGESAGSQQHGDEEPSPIEGKQRVRWNGTTREVDLNELLALADRAASSEEEAKVLRRQVQSYAGIQALKEKIESAPQRVKDTIYKALSGQIGASGDGDDDDDEIPEGFFTPAKKGRSSGSSNIEAALEPLRQQVDLLTQGMLHQMKERQATQHQSWVDGVLDTFDPFKKDSKLRGAVKQMLLMSGGPNLTDKDRESLMGTVGQIAAAYASGGVKPRSASSSISSGKVVSQDVRPKFTAADMRSGRIAASLKNDPRFS